MGRGMLKVRLVMGRWRRSRSEIVKPNECTGGREIQSDGFCIAWRLHDGRMDDT